MLLTFNSELPKFDASTVKPVAIRPRPQTGVEYLTYYAPYYHQVPKHLTRHLNDFKTVGRNLFVRVKSKPFKGGDSNNLNRTFEELAKAHPTKTPQQLLKETAKYSWAMATDEQRAAYEIAKQRLLKWRTDYAIQSAQYSHRRCEKKLRDIIANLRRLGVMNNVKQAWPMVFAPSWADIVVLLANKLGYQVFDLSMSAASTTVTLTFSVELEAVEPLQSNLHTLLTTHEALSCLQQANRPQPIRSRARFDLSLEVNRQVQILVAADVANMEGV